jgi:hypothetical protein
MTGAQVVIWGIAQASATNIAMNPATLTTTPTAQVNLRDHFPHQRDHPEIERRSADDDPTTPESSEVDGGHKLRVFVAQCARDLVKRALRVLGRRRGHSLVGVGPDRSGFIEPPTWPRPDP